MAEPAGAPTPGAAAQSALVATKLHVNPRPGFVRRERLLKQLEPELLEVRRTDPV
jgi:hypothetical protein